MRTFIVSIITKATKATADNIFTGTRIYSTRKYVLPKSRNTQKETNIDTKSAIYDLVEANIPSILLRYLAQYNPRTKAKMLS